MSTANNSKEPLLRIAKRDGISRPKAYAIRLVAVLLSLVVSGIFIFAVTKLNPVDVYKGIYDGAFGTTRRSWVTIRDTMMLLCIGVGLAPAFKMKFWNIGAEGQILIGGVITAGIMRAYGNSISTPALLVIMAVMMPPMSTWPSAPMFQNFILKAGARPTPMHSRVMVSRMVTQLRREDPKAPLNMAS